MGENLKNLREMQKFNFLISISINFKQPNKIIGIFMRLNYRGFELA